jgi:plasmid stability protein
MRQLITRIDDQLHERLRARAAAEGRSVNSLVKELLELALLAGDERARVAARIEAAGLRVVPRPERPAPSRDIAIAATRGAGQVASAALTADRTSR